MMQTPPTPSEHILRHLQHPEVVHVVLGESAFTRHNETWGGGGGYVVYSSLDEFRGPFTEIGICARRDGALLLMRFHPWTITPDLNSDSIVPPGTYHPVEFEGRGEGVALQVDVLRRPTRDEVLSLREGGTVNAWTELDPRQTTSGCDSASICP